MMHLTWQIQAYNVYGSTSIHALYFHMTLYIYSSNREAYFKYPTRAESETTFLPLVAVWSLDEVEHDVQELVSCL